MPESEAPWGNFSNAFFDLFAVAHTLGWFGKMIICRDLKLVLFSSVFFELIEYSLRDVLNNFKECWWDHVFVDIFGCNLLGIALGCCFINYFDLERYKWSLRDAPLRDSTWSHLRFFWSNWDLSKL
jgi:phosphatidylserine synthase 2